MHWHELKFIEQNVIVRQYTLANDYIQISLPLDLSKEESLKKLVELIEPKYPSILENKK